MINEDTLDIDGSVAGFVACSVAEIVRVTVPSNAKALAEIKQNCLRLTSLYPWLPMSHQRHENCLEVAKHVDKVRINPGLYVEKANALGNTQAEFDEMARKSVRL